MVWAVGVHTPVEPLKDPAEQTMQVEVPAAQSHGLQFIVSLGRKIKDICMANVCSTVATQWPHRILIAHRSRLLNWQFGIVWGLIYRFSWIMIFARFWALYRQHEKLNHYDSLLEFLRHRVLSTNRAIPVATMKVPGLQAVHGVSARREAPAQLQSVSTRRSRMHNTKRDLVRFKNN